MTPQQFVSKWKQAELKERSAAQEHFIDLCHLLGEPTPADADPKGDWYCFERGASKVGGGEGWADVWMREHFGWEYKGKRKDLDAALMQLQRYAPALENPPLLIVSDLDRILVHTNWTNTVPKRYEISLDELVDPVQLQTLRWAFSDPDRLKPSITTADVTREAAGLFAQLAQRLRERGHEPQRVAHFLNRLMFCLFAEDAKLLPSKILSRALDVSRTRPETAEPLLRQLFSAMHKGGIAGFESIEWFNGGLFDSDDSLPLLKADIDDILEVAKLDWASVEPSIFGTLFERGLDPSKRSQLGAHYTDPKSIMRIVNPVIVEPLMARWTESKAKIQSALDKADKSKTPTTKKKLRLEAEQTLQGFMRRLSEYQVLDPACGSGNFLYLALQALKDIEHRAALEAEQLGLQRDFTGMNVGVQCLHGIELNSYAAELARVTVWIGEIQWMLKHGVPPSKNPILKPLETIECRDAILNSDGTEPQWPKVDVIIGNPPFLGDKKMRDGLGADYVKRLRSVYDGRVPGGADLVTYWFEKARAQIEAGATRYAGLVGTNSIRGGSNRRVLDQIAETTTIFEGWSDEEWVNEGANVRVSLVCFGNRAIGHLDGELVSAIYPDLTAGGVPEAVGIADLTKARRLPENGTSSFSGIQKTGPFEITGDVARSWLMLPNPTSRGNADVVKPWSNGLDVTRRNRDMWIIDYGVNTSETAAALYEAPFEYAKQHVKPTRVGKREARTNEMWWIFQWARPVMRTAIAGKSRFIVTPEVAKHRVFAWLRPPTVPDKNLVVIARDDDTAFGILHSRFHELWSLGLCTWLGVGNDPRYTPTSTFETFPFPDGLTPDLKQDAYTNSAATTIAAAAAKLDELREAWLNPQDWVDRVPEVVAGYPDRIVAKPGHEAELKKRTLTNLYNAKPTWLANAHRDLDQAVAKAYGWDDYTPAMADEEILRRLLALNLARSTS